MSSFFSFNSSNRFISSASTFLSTIGTFFNCNAKKDGQEKDNGQSPTNSEPPTDSNDTGPLNNVNASILEASGLSGADTQDGGISESSFSYSSSIISISGESSSTSRYSAVSDSRESSPVSPREISPLKLYEAESSLTPPDLARNRLIRFARGVSRSDAREENKPLSKEIEGFKPKIIFTAPPPINEPIKTDKVISSELESSKSLRSTKFNEHGLTEDQVIQLSIQSQILQGRDTKSYKKMSNPDENQIRQPAPVTHGVFSRRSAFTEVPKTIEEQTRSQVKQIFANYNPKEGVTL